jgi:hypothetical protein
MQAPYTLTVLQTPEPLAEFSHIHFQLFAIKGIEAYLSVIHPMYLLQFANLKNIRFLRFYFNSNMCYRTKQICKKYSLHYFNIYASKQSESVFKMLIQFIFIFFRYLL